MGQASADPSSFILLGALRSTEQTIDLAIQKNELFNRVIYAINHQIYATGFSTAEIPPLSTSISRYHPSLNIPAFNMIVLPNISLPLDS